MDPSDALLSDRVLQAAGMVSAQLNCPVDEALGRLRIRAAATDQTLDQLAVDVIDRIIRFS